jgi:hypothetical protein
MPGGFARGGRWRATMEGMATYWHRLRRGLRPIHALTGILSGIRPTLDLGLRRGANALDPEGVDRASRDMDERPGGRSDGLIVAQIECHLLMSR